MIRNVANVGYILKKVLNKKNVIFIYNTRTCSVYNQHQCCEINAIRSTKKNANNVILKRLCPKELIILFSIHFTRTPLHV